MTTATGTERVLRPVRHLPWRSTAAGNLGIVLPAAAVAGVLAVVDDRPGVAVALVALMIATVAIILLPALRIRVRLDEDGITTFWTRHVGSRHVPRDGVARAVIRTIYNGDGLSTNRHLFLLDPADRPVYRMSSRWWTDEQLLTVAHHFSVPLDSQPQPVHLAEVRRTSRDHLGWSERHRVLAGAALIGAAALLCLGFAALITAAL